MLTNTYNNVRRLDPEKGVNISPLKMFCVRDVFTGLSMEMGFSWESDGKCPMGWDGTARIAFPMGPMGQ